MSSYDLFMIYYQWLLYRYLVNILLLSTSFPIYVHCGYPAPGSSIRQHKQNWLVWTNCLSAMFCWKDAASGGPFCANHFRYDPNISSLNSVTTQRKSRSQHKTNQFQSRSKLRPDQFQSRPAQKTIQLQSRWKRKIILFLHNSALFRPVEALLL